MRVAALEKIRAWLRFGESVALTCYEREAANVIGTVSPLHSDRCQIKETGRISRHGPVPLSGMQDICDTPALARFGCE